MKRSQLFIQFFFIVTFISLCFTLHNAFAASWSSMDSRSTYILRSVWGTSATNVYAVGHNTANTLHTILHYDGSTWSEVDNGTPKLNDIWGTGSNNIYTVGNGGAILHYNGIDWSPIASGTTQNLRGIWGTSDSDIFIVGYTCTILHYNGSDWSPMESGITDNLYGVWGSSGSDVYTVGNASGTILHYNGSDWSETLSVAGDALQDIWGSSAMDIFVVGYSGIILHYNGTNWAPMESGTTEELIDVWGTSGSDVFAVGYSGTILNYNGTEWNSMDSGTTTDYLFGVWGSPLDVFTVGTNASLTTGIIRRYTCDADGDCDDGLFCTGSESCVDDSCQPGIAPCSDPTPLCDEANDVCVACFDHGDCGLCEKCEGGVCLFQDLAEDVKGECLDGECVTGFCDGDGACGFDTPGTACGDPSDTDCTDPDICDGVGTCLVNHTASGTSCTDDGNVCTDDECTGAGLCQHIAVEDGLSCDDGMYCNGDDMCSGGLCEHAGRPCSWLCDEINDICLTPSTTTIPFTSDCSTDEDCDDANPCTDDYCNAASCSNVSLVDGTPCDDSLFCTVDDACIEGTCIGTVRECNDELYCTGIESCNEVADQCESSGDPCSEATTCDEAIDECRPSTPCVIRLLMERASVFSGQTVEFTVNTSGDCTAPDYEWSVEDTTIGSTIDQNGTYTADINRNFFKKATDLIKVIDHANGDIVAEATITVSWNCFLLRLYGEGSEEAAILRSFRDDVLAQTAEGREIIRFYYQWSPSLVKMIEFDEDFKNEVKATLDEILPLIREEK